MLNDHLCALGHALDVFGRCECDDIIRSRRISLSPKVPIKLPVVKAKPSIEDLLGEVQYFIWPPNQIGGQHVGAGSQGIKGVHPLGFEAISTNERSQHKNKQIVKEMLEWALSKYVGN